MEKKAAKKNHWFHKTKIVAVSGYFDPIHIGHIDYLEMAKKLGDKLLVIVNNDYQANLKKGYSFMCEDERIKIVKSLRCVDDVVKSIDMDRTIRKTLIKYQPHIFANGGDRNNKEIPESKICKEYGIEIIDGLGAKVQSSSSLVARFKKYNG